MIKAVQSLMLTKKYLKENEISSIISPQVRKAWAREVLSILNFQVAVSPLPAISGPAIYVANHISYMDIPLLMATIENCCFVSKVEIASWPLFGKAAKKIETVFVTRGSKSSHHQARREIEHELVMNKKKIVVFPAGTTTIGDEKYWRKGVFEIAKNLVIPILPVRISYSQLREVAYIDQDFFPYHLYKMGKQKNISAQVELHEPILVRDVHPELEYCRSWCNDLKARPVTKKIINPKTVLTEA